MKPTAEQIKAIALIVDGEAWKAIEDGRDALPGNLWGFRRDIAMEKAMAIAALSVPAAAVVGEPVAWTTQAQIDKFKVDPGCNAVMWGEPLPHHPDIPLYAAPSAPDGWQPIDSAPHGVTVLLATPPFKSMGEQAAWELRVGAASWGERIGGISNISRDAWATHWKPLPSPPTGGDSHE